MCVKKKKPPGRIDFFGGSTKKMVGARAHRVTEEDEPKYRDPGMKVTTRGRSRFRPPSNDVPEHELETSRFVESGFVYQPCSDLPPMGWIQNCLFCDSATTSLMEVGSLKGYCCGRCTKAFSRGDRAFVIKSAARRRF